MRRRKLERIVSVLDVEDLMPHIQWRIAEGCLYGDFQFAIDPRSDDFLRMGVFSCYRPLPDDAIMPDDQEALGADDWLELLYLAHEDKTRAFDTYAEYYRSTNGQRYWSDTHQLSEYLDDYHERIDHRLTHSGCGTEMITEVYVPRNRLAEFMAHARADLREAEANVVYGTIRFIEADTETFLPWARDDYACIIFNLHTTHDRAAIEKTAASFRKLIDRAISKGGSYYLTYHRWASRRQVNACYPEMVRFLQRKLHYDPCERFQSEWYRHYRSMYADALDAPGNQYMRDAMRER